MDGRKLLTPDLYCCDVSRENALSPEGRLSRPNKSGEALVSMQRFCHSQTVNGNTYRGWQLMAQRIMKLPTDFAIEPRTVKLALKITCPWEVLGTNRLQCRHLCTGSTTFHMPKKCKVEVFWLLVAVVFLPVEMFALCALAPVEPVMSKADYWRICRQSS